MFKLIKSILKAVSGIFAILFTAGLIVQLSTRISIRKQIKSKMVTVHGVDIVHCPSTLGYLGLGIAGAVRFVDGSKYIVVDDLFFTLDDRTQKGVLAHEEGHIALGHCDSITESNTAERQQLMALGIVQPIELEADAYGASKVGTADMVYTLRALSRIPGMNGKQKQEFQKRIFALTQSK